MTPKISVSPLAIKNSSRPYCESIEELREQSWKVHAIAPLATVR